MAPHQQIDDSVEPEKFQIVTSSKKEILYDGYLYDVTSFIHKHPGGDNIILNFAEEGEDATLAIQQFHGRSIDKVLKLLQKFPKRPEPKIELSKEVEQVRQRNAAMTSDFIKLYSELKDEGMFNPSYSHWICRLVELFAIWLIGYSLILDSLTLSARSFGCFVLAMGIGKAGWVVHEFGHHSATGIPKLDRFIQAVLMGVCLGWSGVWWRRHHNLHHAMTARVKVDPDTDLLPPVMVFNTDILNDLKKDQNFFIRHQIFFMLFYTLGIAFRWHLQTVIYLVREKQVVELISVFCHYFLMYQIGFQMWLPTYFLYTVFFYGNAALAHTFLPVVTTPTHWIEQSFVNTVDIEHRPWCDWWMGYLNYQIEHHLFPTLPQFRGPLIVPRVKALAEKHGLPYQLCFAMFIGSNLSGWNVPFHRIHISIEIGLNKNMSFLPNSLVVTNKISSI